MERLHGAAQRAYRTLIISLLRNWAAFWPGSSGSFNAIGPEPRGKTIVVHSCTDARYMLKLTHFDPF